MLEDLIAILEPIHQATDIWCNVLNIVDGDSTDLRNKLPVEENRQ